MSIRRNIVANYIGAGITSLAPILALPWYISILGMKYWGLISFIAVLQGILGLVNAGIAQVLVREFAGLIADQENGKKKIAKILFGFERLYWLFAMVAAILLCSSVNLILSHWIKLGDIPVEIGQAVVFGAAALFATQFPVAVYRSVLFGCGMQVSQNILQSGGAILKHAGGIVVLLLYRSIYAYLVWNIAITLLETLLTARVSWRFLKVDRDGLRWDSSEMRRLFAFTMSMSAVVLLAVMTMQIDKLVLSWMLPIEQLGYYTIASSVAMGMLQVFSPVASAVLPKIVQLKDQSLALEYFNKRVFALMLGIAFGIVAVFFFAGKDLLELWLRDKKVVEIVYPVMALLISGTAMNAIYNVGYMNWLALGKAKKILVVNAASLSLSIIFVPILVAKYGLMGAAGGWIVINLLGLLLSLDWLVKREVIHVSAC